MARTLRGLVYQQLEDGVFAADHEKRALLRETIRIVAGEGLTVFRLLEMFALDV